MPAPLDDKIAGQFDRGPLPAQSIFPRTDYFEVDSVQTGARYAVWITTPLVYDRDTERRFALIYSPDGNRNMPVAAATCDLSEWDLMDPFQPTIQVSIGYTDADADRALAVRARDLLPPKEALPDGMIESMKQYAENAVLDRAGTDLYIRNLENPAGDRFLAFIETELHPFIAANYRIDAGSVGLFGHSYGGLFATYAALQRATIFRNFGASSPGILPERSVIFQLYADAIREGGLSERNLHMMVATREITDPGTYQALVGAGTTEFIKRAGQSPIQGLTFSSLLIDHETHITVKTQSFHSFLRRFYLERR